MSPDQRPDVPLTAVALAEGIGTAVLVATVVGSGVAATRLSPHDAGLQLLENALATGAALVALVLAFGAVSAAFNPVVVLVARLRGETTTRVGPVAVAAQGAGGIVGAVLANLMFGLPAVSWPSNARSTPAHLLAEVVATYGLVLLVFLTLHHGDADKVAVVVGTYITAAYWFTSSTSFANPAVTLARAFSDTFAGIAPSSVAPFVAAQLVGALLATATLSVLAPVHHRMHRPSPPEPSEESR